MKFSDLVVILVMYAVCAFFTSQTLALPEAAQTYPLCLLAGLGLLNTIFLLNCLWRMPKRCLVYDVPEIFRGFLGGQFFPVLLACVGYLVLMPFGGFYLTSVVFLVGVLCFLRVPKWHALLTVGLLIALIYGVFSLFLKVPLPGGTLLQG